MPTALTGDALYTPTPTTLPTVTSSTAHSVQLAATTLTGDTRYTYTPVTISTVYAQAARGGVFTGVSYPVTSFTPTTLTVTASTQLAASAAKVVPYVVAAAHYTIPEPIRSWNGTTWTYFYKPRY